MNSQDSWKGITAVGYSVLLILAAIGIGFVLRGFRTLVTVSAIVCSAFVLLSVVLGGIYFAKSKKKYEGFGYDEIQQMIFGSKDLAESDYDSYYKTCRRGMTVLTVYEVLIFLVGFWGLCCALAIFLFEKVGIASVVLGTIAAILLFVSTAGVAGLFFAVRPRMKIDPLLRINEVSSPKLYRFFADTLVRCGLDPKCAVFQIGEEMNASVCTVHGKTYFMIGVLLLRFASAEELRTIIAHECAHVLSGDNDIHAILGRFNYRWENANRFFSIFRNFQFGALLVKTYLDINVFNLVSTIIRERRADAFVKERFDAQTYIDVTAKCEIYSLHLFALATENRFDEPEIQRHFSTYQADDFLKSYRENGQMWLELAKKVIPARIDSHPSFRQRMDAFGCSDFSVELNPVLIDAAEVKLATERYEEWFFRESSFQFRRSTIEKERNTAILKDFDLETLSVEDNPESLSRVLAIGEAADALCRYDLSESIYRRVLEVDPENAAALYRLGSIRILSFDPTGIPMVERAMARNPNYHESGHELIGNACLRLGLEEKIEEFRKNQKQAYENQVQKYSKLDSLKKSDDLRPASLAPEVLRENLEYIQTKQSVAAAWLIRKVISEDFETHIYVLRRNKKYSWDQYQKEYEEIVSFLDQKDEQYCTFSGMSFERVAKRVEGSLIFERPKAKNK